MAPNRNYNFSDIFAKIWLGNILSEEIKQMFIVLTVITILTSPLLSVCVNDLIIDLFKNGIVPLHVQNK